MNKNLILCGVGGQGTVLASKLLAAAAMKKGLRVMSAETIGMAQRGGSVFSHLRFGEQLDTPMLRKGTADVMLGFEPAEAVRMLPFLKEDGFLAVSSRGVTPVSASLQKDGYSGDKMIDYLKRNVKHLLVVDADRACAELGSAKVLNVLLLGAAVQSGGLGLTQEDILQAMKECIPKQFLELNQRALDYTKKEGCEQ